MRAITAYNLRQIPHWLHWEYHNFLYSWVQKPLWKDHAQEPKHNPKLPI